MSAGSSCFEEKLRDRLARLVWRDGHVVLPAPSDWGWYDGVATVHARDCDLASWTELTTVEWVELEDDEVGDVDYEGLQIVATCRCGQLTGRQVRLIRSFDEALSTVFAETILD